MPAKSINQAIITGQLWVNLPTVLSIVGVPFLFWQLSEPIQSLGLRIMLMVLSIFVGIALGWFWWSYFITKWRIWAFRVVAEDDWINLKRKAIATYLIWDDGVIFELTEIRTPEEQGNVFYVNQRIEELKEIEEIMDDLATPAETTYFLNIGILVFMLLIKLFVIFMGVLIIYYVHFIPGIFIILYSIFSETDHYRFLFLDKNKPLLIINEEGIFFEDKQPQFWAWEEISFFSVDKKRRKMTLGIIVGEELPPKEVTYILGHLKIKDYNLFFRIVSVYVNRFVLKLID